MPIGLTELKELNLTKVIMATLSREDLARLDNLWRQRHEGLKNEGKCRGCFSQLIDNANKLEIKGSVPAKICPRLIDIVTVLIPSAEQEFFDKLKIAKDYEESGIFNKLFNDSPVSPYELSLCFSQIGYTKDLINSHDYF